MKIIEQLSKQLKLECGLYNKLLELISSEKEILESFKPDDLPPITTQKEILLTQIEEHSKARQHLVSELAALRSYVGPKVQEDSHRLSDVVMSICSREELFKLLPLIESYRSLVVLANKKSIELSKLLLWLQEVVSGTVSIVRSAAQTEVKSYSSKGGINSSYHPNHSRESIRLKEV